MDQQIDYERLAASLLRNAGQTTKAVSSTPSASWAHGRGGLFSAPGLSQALFSAMVLPTAGVASTIPARKTRDSDPLDGIITGVTASTGSNPTGVCDDPKTAGLTKLCTHTFPLGRLSMQTEVLQLDRVGEMTNRGEFDDFVVYGDPFAGAEGEHVPNIVGMGGIQSAARREVGKKLFELAVSWQREFAQLVFTGNPANNTAGGGYKEWWGLDALVNTGYRDAETGVACPAADSLIRSFAGADIGSNGATLVKEITNVYRNLKYLAKKAGLDPVEIRLAMTYGTFYAVTDLWPCAYLSYRCSPSTGSTNFIDSGEAEKMRDAMRGDLYAYEGQYLLIDGQRVPVVIDDSIAETQPVAGQFNSTIYFLPYRVLGNVPVLFWEYFDFDGPGGAMEAANLFAPDGSFYTSDNGRFLWHRKPPTNVCVQLVSYAKPRIKLLTPYLAARLTNVRYTPLIHERSWNPDASFYADGGKTARDTTLPSYFSPTA